MGENTDGLVCHLQLEMILRLGVLGPAPNLSRLGNAAGNAQLGQELRMLLLITY